MLTYNSFWCISIVLSRTLTLNSPLSPDCQPPIISPLCSTKTRYNFLLYDPSQTPTRVRWFIRENYLKRENSVVRVVTRLYLTTSQIYAYAKGNSPSVAHSGMIFNYFFMRNEGDKGKRFIRDQLKLQVSY